MTVTHVQVVNGPAVGGSDVTGEWDPSDYPFLVDETTYAIAIGRSGSPYTTAIAGGLRGAGGGGSCVVIGPDDNLAANGLAKIGYTLTAAGAVVVVNDPDNDAFTSTANPGADGTTLAGGIGGTGDIGDNGNALSFAGGNGGWIGSGTTGNGGGGSAGGGGNGSSASGATAGAGGAASGLDTVTPNADAGGTGGNGGTIGNPGSNGTNPGGGPGSPGTGNNTGGTLGLARLVIVWQENTPAPPVNTVVPAISGSPTPGYTLTGTQGTWVNSPTSYSNTWQRANDVAGTPGSYSDIAGENSTTYAVVAVDRGKWLRFSSAGINSEGSGTRVYSAAKYVYPGTVIGNSFDGTSGFAGRFIISDHTVSDGSEVTMPSPVVWDTGSPQASVDWSFHTVAVNRAGHSRSNWSGANLISPSFAVVANHAIGDGTGYEWLQPNGTVLTRTRSLVWNIDGDLTVIKLNAPITTIAPLAIMADIAALAGKTAIAIEANRHLSLHVLDAALENTDTETVFAAGSDPIETGDSSHALIVLINGRPVMALSGFYTATTGPNPSHYLAEIAAILATAGEQMTLVRFADVGESQEYNSAVAFSPALPCVFTPTNFPRLLIPQPPTI